MAPQLSEEREDRRAEEEIRFQRKMIENNKGPLMTSPLHREMHSPFVFIVVVARGELLCGAYALRSLQRGTDNRR